MPDYNSSILKDIGRSYVVSSLLPASIAIILGVLIFKELVPSDLKDSLISSTVPFGGLIVAFIVFSIWLGFAFYNSQSFIIPLFEGYHLPEWLKKNLINRQKRRFSQAQEKLRESKASFDRLKNDPLPSDDVLRQNILASMEKASERGFNAAQDLLLEAPLKEEDLLPTRLGNVLRAGEYYPGLRYGFDAANLWERLSTVLPQKFRDNMEEINNRLMFLINSSLAIALIASASFLTSIFYWGMALFQILKPYIKEQIKFHYAFLLSLISQHSGVFEMPAITVDGTALSKGCWFAVWGFVLIIIAYFLYFLSTRAAIDFSALVQTAYDLYRHDLIKKFHLKVPGTLKKEKKLWEEINEFIVIGEQFHKAKKFKYHDDAPTEQSHETEPD